MIDKISHDRILLLHPKIREEVGLLVDFVNEKVLTGKAKMRVISTLRTFKEQDELYAQGRTKPGQRVTNAKGGQSNHNFGLSFDFALIVDTNGDGVYETTSWDTVKDYDADKIADWIEVINLFKKHGYESGADWKSLKDFPHLQKTFELSVQECNKRYQNKDFIPGTTYIKI